MWVKQVGNLWAPGNFESNVPPISQIGSLPIGDAIYNVPSDAIFVALNGNDVIGTGRIESPYATLSKAIAMSIVNDTIVIRGGEYHQGAAAYSYISINKAGLTIQNYPTEAVWFDGSSVVGGWVQHSTNVWKKLGWAVNFPYDYSYGQNSTSNSSGFVGTSYPCAHMPDQCFIDGVPQAQVATLGEVTSGKFYVDKVNDIAYIGTNPANREVRLSDLSVCCIALAADVTIRGIGFRRYGNPIPDQGPVRLHRARGVLENVISEYNATTGIGIMNGSLDCVLRNVTSRYNGLMGVGCYQADGCLIEGCDISYNNQEMFNSSPSAGGLKITRTQTATFRNSRFNYNKNAPGLWLDEAVRTFTIVSNDMIGNGTNGLALEISDEGIVADNLMAENLTTQFIIMSTDDVRIWNNTIAGNAHECVVFQQDNRYSWDGRTGVRDNRQPESYYATVCTWWMDSFEFFNNVLGESRYTPFRVKQYSYTSTGHTPLPSKGWAEFGIVADGNLYNRTNRDATHSPTALADVWSTGVPGAGQTSATMTLWRSNSTAYGRSADAHSMEISGVGVLDSAYMLTPTTKTATQSVGRPLPADVANLVGLQAGATQIGAWR